MAHVTFLPDKQAPPTDGKLLEIAAQATLASRAIRLRLQPDLYNFDKQNYDSWVGAAWTLDLDDAEEGRKFLAGLASFMRGFGDAEKQGKLLKALGEL
jgi:hypothetical protein